MAVIAIQMLCFQCVALKGLIGNLCIHESYINNLHLNKTAIKLQCYTTKSSGGIVF